MVVNKQFTLDIEQKKRSLVYFLVDYKLTLDILELQIKSKKNKGS